MSPETPEDYQEMAPGEVSEVETAETAQASEAPPPRRAALAVPPAGSRPVRFDPLNLAGRPFLNTRPVVRVSLLLWGLGLLLLLGNVSRYLSFRESSADKRAQIEHGEEETTRQQQVARRLQSQLDSFELEQENQRVDFLNLKIQERTFSWSALLDRIAERMPNDVRLNRLSPVTGDRRKDSESQSSRVAVRRNGPADQVPLTITGEARNSEALEAFIERLYKAPFDYPNPARQETQDNGSIKFELSVQYRPGSPAPAGSPAGPATPAPKIEELPMPGAAGSTATAAPGAAAPPAPRGGRP